MKFIDFNSDKCDECFKCLRACPTKAISFQKHKRLILDELCIKCGLCQMQCKTGALTIHLDLETVQRQVKSNIMTIVSLAPSFAGAFQMKSPEQMATALRKLGFNKVEETARGAEIVSLEYENHMTHTQESNLITSCCPASNALIERYYEQAIPNVIPVVSPMVAHGFDIKKRYGDNTFVVFIGPCLAKKAEALSYDNSIDAVITFRELEKWLSEESIDLRALDLSSFDTPTTRRGKAYPLGGSLWKKDMKTRINSQYDHVHVNGIEACTDFLTSVSKNEISGFCAELNICAGSCINGPDMPESAPGIYKRISLVTKYVEQSKKLDHTTFLETPISLSPETLHHVFIAQNQQNKQIDDGKVYEILMEMGKYTQQDQLDCGACGYSTCYDKAIAVSKGHSDISMCMDLLRKKAEGMQSIIFEASPNAICILDDELRIMEVNPAFHQLFNASRIKLNQWPISALIDHEIINEISVKATDKISRKISLSSINKSFYANMIRIFDGKHYIGIFTDITESENNRQEIERMKKETLYTCQEVIDHQMRVAQEIASLLGETTAETKIGLNKLKKLVLSDGGDNE